MWWSSNLNKWTGQCGCGRYREQLDWREGPNQVQRRHPSVRRKITCITVYCNWGRSFGSTVIFECIATPTGFTGSNFNPCALGPSPWNHLGNFPTHQWGQWSPGRLPMAPFGLVHFRECGGQDLNFQVREERQVVLACGPRTDQSVLADGVNCTRFSSLAKLRRPFAKIWSFAKVPGFSRMS